MNFNSAPSLIKLNTSSLVPEQVICFPSLGSRTFPPAHGFLLRLIRSPPHFYSSVNLTTQSGPLLVAPGEGAEGACSVFSLIRAVRGPAVQGTGAHSMGVGHAAFAWAPTFLLQTWLCLSSAVCYPGRHWLPRPPNSVRANLSYLIPALPRMNDGIQDPKWRKCPPLG